MRHQAYGALSRRQALSLALLPLLQPAHEALALPSLPFFSSSDSSVKVTELESPSVCQARLRDQDFVAITYIGQFADGRVFDDRYAMRPLVYELGGFYLDGVDQALAGRCVGTKLQLTWPSSPAIRVGVANDLRRLPAGSALQMELEVRSIKYSLFGEKMRDPSNQYWFSPSPLTLTSPVEARGHLTSRAPLVKKDNPFSIAPGEKSIISIPSNTLVPLLDGLTE